MPSTQEAGVSDTGNASCQSARAAGLETEDLD